MKDSNKISISDAPSDLAGISIQSGIIKLIHQYLLQNYPSKDVFEFWKTNLPNAVSGPHDLKVFFDSILIANKSLSIEYVMKVLVSFESFLIDKGDITEDFPRKLFDLMLKTGAGNFAKTIHYWMPIFKKMQSDNVDIRYNFLLFGNYSSRYICRRFYFQVVKKAKEGNIYNITLLVAMKNHSGLFAPHFDCDTWIGGRIKSVPTMFGLPEYEEVNIISDVKTISEITQSESIVSKDASSQSGAVKGKRYPFQDFINRKAIEIPPLNSKALQTEVVEVIDDYYCPRKKRIVLHKGCVYGAPVYLFQIILAESKVRNVINTISHTMSVIEKEKNIEPQMQKLHDAFLMQGQHTCAFLYEKKSDILTLNGKWRCPRIS